MGMFDTIICKYPLPGTQPELIKDFQTKSLDCTLDYYQITEDGNLIRTSDSEYEKGNIDHFTGTINFYNSNICSAGWGCKFTANGEDYESVEYVATFVDGFVTSITQVEYEREVCLSSKDVPGFHKEIRKESELAKIDNLVGTKIVYYYKFLNREDSYEAEVVYQSNNKYCVKCEDGKLELVDRYMLGSSWFKNKEEAIEIENYGKKVIEECKKVYNEKLKLKKNKV